MAENKETTKVEKPAKADKPAKKANKPSIVARIKKFCKDVVGEMKKVVWTSKEDLKKSTKLVIVTVVAVALTIAVVDTVCSFIINSLAGLVG